jgi:hypothetical protein
MDYAILFVCCLFVFMARQPVVRRCIHTHVESKLQHLVKLQKRDRVTQSGAMLHDTRATFLLSVLCLFNDVLCAAQFM